MEANERNLDVVETDAIDIQKYWQSFQRHWLPAAAIFATTVGLAAVYTFNQKPIYRAQARLLLANGQDELELPGIGTGFGTAGRQSDPLKNQAAILKSRPIVQQVINQLDLRDREGLPAEPTAVLERLTVQSVPETSLLELSYQSPDPEEAARVVDTFMDIYQENNVQTNRSEAAAAREFIEEQLPKTEASVREAEEDLRRFKERNNVIALTEEAASTVESLGLFDRELATARAALAEARARRDELTARVGLEADAAVTAASLSQSEPVQEVLSQYRTVEAELAVKRERYQPQHPTILNLEEERAALSALLDRRLQETGASAATATRPETLQLGDTEVNLVEDLVRAEVQYQVAARRIDVLSAQSEAYRARAQNLPRLEQSQRELERQLRAAQSTYEVLLQRLQEVRVAENQNLGNARVVEHAVPPEYPIHPRKKLHLAMGGFVGTLLGAATVLALESRDRTLKTVQDARNALDYVMLGSVPLFRLEKEQLRDTDDRNRPVVLPLRDAPRSSISEAFRMLQANLKFSSADRKLQVLTITSSVPREGKSTTSANLGLALAELGNRVLIIDADMRRPSQQQVWELPNAVGLSNVLVEQIDLQAAIANEAPTLDVLTAGAPPPNPVALLDSQRMQQLLAQCRDSYDYVLVDTPPLAVAADAAILGKMSDGMLVVVRPGVVDVPSVNSTREVLERSRQSVIGMVVNGVNPSKEPDSYYYYYAQGYHADAEQSKPKKRSFLFSRRS